MSKVSIERVVNGWELEYKDPDIEKENRKPKAGMYRNPMKEMVFKTSKEVTDFLTKNLDKLCSVEDYSSSFDEALMENENDD
jgi:hypothetical protein